MEKEQECGVMENGRATIDTRPPFRSVKEAVALFGEKVLVGEIYAKQLNQMQPMHQPSKLRSEKQNVIPILGSVSAELEETKQNLQKTREEGNYMADCLKSLREELEQTKRELQELKATSTKQYRSNVINPEIEELKFVKISSRKDIGIDDEDNSQHEVQKKKFVTFASPPSLTREIVQNHNNVDDDRARNKFQRTPSFKEEAKKKSAGSFMGWLFSARKKKL